MTDRSEKRGGENRTSKCHARQTGLFAIYKFRAKTAMAVDRPSGESRENLTAFSLRTGGSSCLYASREGGPFAARRVINSPLLGDGVSGHPAEIHVQIAAEYVSEFVPCPVRLPRVLFTELFTRTNKCDKRVYPYVSSDFPFPRDCSRQISARLIILNDWRHFRTIGHAFLTIAADVSTIPLAFFISQ